MEQPEFADSDEEHHNDDGFIVADFNLSHDSISKDESSEATRSDAEETLPTEDYGFIALNTPNHLLCAHCRRPFHSMLALKQHASREHSMRVKPFACAVDQCGKAFRTRFSLKRHMMTHSGERPFCCETCGRGFLEKGHLLVHRRIHSGEKPFKCSYCSRSFAHKPHAVEHERIHSGERPYKCFQCDKAFKRQTHLRNHEKVMHRAGSLK